jgi:hypothetical protein
MHQKSCFPFPASAIMLYTYVHTLVWFASFFCYFSCCFLVACLYAHQVYSVFWRRALDFNYLFFHKDSKILVLSLHSLLFPKHSIPLPLVVIIVVRVLSCSVSSIDVIQLPSSIINLHYHIRHKQHIHTTRLNWFWSSLVKVICAKRSFIRCQC